uniref:Uncharacterized protein n=1 Tax=Chenopodium quinoa TaxID=63459 RepID=A0A803LQ12_CHEQI
MWVKLEKVDTRHLVAIAVALRMISFGCDYHWAQKDSRFDQEERSLEEDKYSYIIYLCYLLYAPLYIAGPIISFNAFASQIDRPQNTYLPKDVALYGLTWAFSLCLVELITHFFYYNAFATSGLWKQLSALDVFIIGYGLNGIEAPENMPKCINNCHNLESFWKSWHASFNKWLVRYLYIPLGGAQTKLLNVWVIFTFVAIWHDLEWKLLSWAWLTCIFFIPEILLKSAAKAFKVESTFWKFFFEELSAISGAVTITCLMIANLVGFVVGPSGINFLISGFLHKEGLPVLAGIFFTFYLGTKLMFHIRDARQKSS